MENENWRRIAITPGEPAGIGPDICIRLIQNALPAEPVVIADAGILERRANKLGLNLKLYPFDPDRPVKQHQAGELGIVPISAAVRDNPQHLDPNNAHYVINTIHTAVNLCQKKIVDALVTGPIHKGIINQAGIPFTGHTELLAAITGTKTVVMMLVSSELRVALATTHLPLRAISSAITHDQLREIILVLHHELIKRFRINQPRILVCGLNPHAGENGHLGNEEKEIISPVIEKLITEGLNLIGPLPADTAFITNRLTNAAAVLAMYHDQGLPVIKYLGFGRTVNVTLGLPIIRTSVDHGTALELAGTGRADQSSLIAAFNLALTLL